MFGAQWKLEEEDVVPMVAMLANAGPNDYWRRMWRQKPLKLHRGKPAVDEVNTRSKSYRRTTAAVIRTTAPQKKRRSTNINALPRTSAELPGP